jgi:hypothetical protein
LLVAVCGILTGVAAELLDGGPTFERQRGINITGMSLLPAICFLGVIILIGFLNRKRIDRFRRNMTNRDVLSVIFAVLGVFSYLAVFEYIAAVFARWSSVADALAALALLSATWLLKGELQDRPTKALRFGVLFSVVFTLLNVATFLGLKALVGSL